MTNDDDLTPRVCAGGPALAFDLDGLRVGAAEYDEGPTGCTVVLLRRGTAAAVDVRGGAVGFVGDYPMPDAICLAGGSLLGLEAAAGAAAELHAAAAYPTGFMEMPAVSGAIVFDFHTRPTPVYPDKALGRAAVRGARPGWFPLGRRGAGRSAGVGQGAATRQDGAVTVVVFSVVNALGALVDRAGRVVSGGSSGPGAGGRPTAEEIEERARLARPARPGSTTLTVVATNARLGAFELRQTGRQVHASMARAIQPFHTIFDGDVLWTVSTGDGPEVDPIALGVLASEVTWDAVLASASGATRPASAS